MTKPTIEEIQDYFFLQLQDLEVSKEESEKFFNYYGSCGWIVGRNKPMRNWQFAVNNWIKNYKSYKDERANFNKESNFKDRFQRW